jgi:hypothetical protein
VVTLVTASAPKTPLVITGGVDWAPLARIDASDLQASKDYYIFATGIIGAFAPPSFGQNSYDLYAEMSIIDVGVIQKPERVDMKYVPTQYPRPYGTQFCRAYKMTTGATPNNIDLAARTPLRFPKQPAFVVDGAAMIAFHASNMNAADHLFAFDSTVRTMTGSPVKINAGFTLPSGTGKWAIFYSTELELLNATDIGSAWLADGTTASDTIHFRQGVGLFPSSPGNYPGIPLRKGSRTAFETTLPVYHHEGGFAIYDTTAGAKTVALWAKDLSTGATPRNKTLRSDMFAVKISQFPESRATTFSSIYTIPAKGNEAELVDGWEAAGPQPSRVILSYADNGGDKLNRKKFDWKVLFYKLQRNAVDLSPRGPVGDLGVFTSIVDETCPMMRVSVDDLADGPVCDRIWYEDEGVSAESNKLFDVNFLSFLTPSAFALNDPSEIAPGPQIVIDPETESVDPTSLSALPVAPNTIEESLFDEVKKHVSDMAYSQEWPTFLRPRRHFILTWQGLSDSDYQSLVSFIDGLGPNKGAFQYTPPEESDPIALALLRAEVPSRAISKDIRSVSIRAVELIYTGP